MLQNIGSLTDLNRFHKTGMGFLFFDFCRDMKDLPRLASLLRTDNPPHFHILNKTGGAFRELEAGIDTRTVISFGVE